MSRSKHEAPNDEIKHAPHPGDAAGGGTAGTESGFAFGGKSFDPQELEKLWKGSNEHYDPKEAPIDETILSLN